MANDPTYPRQENYFSDEVNSRIVQGSNFSGTVLESVGRGPDARDAPNIVWGGDWRVSHDMVDGSRSRVFQGGSAPVPRPRVLQYGRPEVTSPMERSQEQSNEPAGRPVLLSVRRRNNSQDSTGGSTGFSEEDNEILLRERRAALVREYNDLSDPTLQRLLSVCSPLVDMDVDIERKYVELDIWRVLEANKEKSRFLHLTQGLGILEKYAANLIKESRPPYWRTVKFTSSLVQVHVGKLIGSRDILSQMGYTEDIQDGVTFPSNVNEPDVNRLRNLAPDLFFARYEIDALLVGTHPFYELDPPISRDEVQIPVLLRASHPPSRPQPFPPRVSATAQEHQPQSGTGRPVVPAPRNTSRGTQPSRSPSSPMPAARRQGNRKPGSPPDGKGSKSTDQLNQEPQATAESNTESEEDSEYEDAEDGLVSSNGSTVAQTKFECRVCGESIATMYCKECKDTFCGRCSDLYHNHPSRQRHIRTDLVTPTAGPCTGQSAVSNAAAIDVATSASGTTASGTEQQSHTVASPIATAASAGERSRPVPAPRRNKTPLPSHEGVTQSARVPALKQEGPSPSLQPRTAYDTSQGNQTTPTYPTVQQSSFPRSSGMTQVTAITSPPAVASASSNLPSSVVGGQSVVPQPVISTTSSQAQSQRREIRRPPPLDSFNTATQPSTLGAYDERDNEVVVKSGAAPPPLPPRPSHTAKPKVPVESKGVSQEVAIPEKGSALSCPNCFCLNSGDAKNCLFCKMPLTVKSHWEPTTQRSNLTEARNFPPPLWALSPEQRVTAQQMQSSGAGQIPVEPDKWACEHCTYHNPRTRRICEVCCKTSSNYPEPTQKADFGEQQATPREAQNVTNMAMQINSEKVQTVTEPTKKTDLQATATGIPSRAAQVGQQTRVWEGTGTVPPTNPPGPTVTTAFQGVGIHGQGAILNTSGVVNPEVPVRSTFPGVVGNSQGRIGVAGAIPEVAVRNLFTREFGLPYGPQGFPPPPPMMQPAGPMGPGVPAGGPFPAPMGNVLTQQPFFPAFPQAPTPFATSTAFSEEDIRKHQEEIYIAGSLYVEWLRRAEKEGFTAEELNIASVLGIDDPQGPVHWLHTTWYDLIHKVMVELAVPENSQEIGNISPEEVREALIECTGEVSRSTAKCIEIRKKKVKELQQAGVYAKTDCISALDTSEGDSEKAILSLEKMTMRPILQRVLNSCLPDSASQDEVFLLLTRQTESQSAQDKANFEAIVKDKDQNLDRRIRAVLAEKDVSSWGRAETAIRLIDMGFSVEDSIEAAHSCGDFQRSLRYLQQECPLCAGEKPMSQMVTFLHCQDRVCSECVSRYITITIKDKNILRLVCPVCGKPENLDDEAVATEYFNNFDILIRGLVDQETHDLFQRKLRDRTLMKEPNFRWCSHCSSGFINEQPGQIRMMCPHCRQYTCFKCKRQWEDQHEGISCEQFAAWKEANDPEFQAAGLAAHLKMNGIVCPSCKYRYDLSKGGCMHFKCAMCPHEFCSGCYNPFLNPHGQNCRVSERCFVRGLHAHHPRDCYFYLRDRSPEELQQLLRDNNVEYNTEPPEGQGNASDDEAAPGAAAAAAPLQCKVKEQKETENGLVDAECGADVPDGHAGLCGKHYVEYLVVLVNDNLLDPADIMSPADLTRVLERGFVNPPVKPNGMNDQQYRQLLLRTVKQQLPLPPKSPRKRILDDEDDVQVVENVEHDFDSDEDDDDDDDDDDDNIMAHGPLLDD